MKVFKFGWGQPFGGDNFEIDLAFWEQDEGFYMRFDSSVGPTLWQLIEIGDEDDDEEDDDEIDMEESENGDRDEKNKSTYERFMEIIVKR